MTVDAYGVNDGVYLGSGGRILASCRHVHTRRKFESALSNDTERDLRRLTVGRKNWMFIGSSAAGDVAATMYTLIASGSRHQLDLCAYVDDVLRSLASGTADLDSLLPDRWREAHPESIRTYREAEKETRRIKTKVRRARRRKLASRG